MSEKVFVNGLFVQDRTPSTPDFVLGRFSIKSAELIAFLQQNTNEKGYCNIDLKKSQNGKKYFELNNWKPAQQAPAPAMPQQAPPPPAFPPASPADEMFPV